MLHGIEKEVYLGEIWGHLTKKQRYVLFRISCNEKQNVIAEELGITESRVSQIKREAIKKIHELEGIRKDKPDERGAKRQGRKNKPR